MAAQGIQDILLGQDMMSKHGMKPWWETWRGYFMAAAVSSALSMLYISSVAAEIHCLPRDESLKFTNMFAGFVNNYCLSQVPDLVSCIGFVSIIIIFVIFSSYNWWLLVPNVISSFDIFKKTAEAAESVDMNQKGNLDIPTETFRDIMYHESSITKLHNIRFISSVSIFLIGFGVHAYIIFYVFSLRYLFECSLTGQIMPNLFTSVTEEVIFTCSYKGFHTILFFLVIFMGSLLLQMIVTIVGYIKIRQFLRLNALPHNNDDISKEFRETRKYVMFMLCIWINSKHSSSKFEEILRHIFSVEMVYKVSARFMESFRHGNAEHFHLFIQMRNNAECQILQEILKTHRDNKVPTAHFRLPNMWELVNRCKFTGWNQTAKNLAEILDRNKNWEHFVVLLNKIKKPGAMEQTRGDRTFDLDEFSCELSGKVSQNSILFYALTKDIYDADFDFTAAKHILSCARKERQRMFVHYGGRSDPVEHYINKMDDKSVGENMKKTLLSLSVNSEHPTPSKSQQKIAEITETFEECVSNYKMANIEEHQYEKQLKTMADKILLFKFTHWDQHAQQLAKRSVEEKQWEIFVNLLNSKTVTQNENRFLLLKQNCGVQNFNLEEMDVHNCSILFYALQYRDVFVTTAAQHILACSSGRKNLVKNGEKMDAAAFVKDWPKKIGQTNKICGNILNMIANSERNVSVEA